jgi:hypothetical protein
VVTLPNIAMFPVADIVSYQYLKHKEVGIKVETRIATKQNMSNNTTFRLENKL